MSTISERVMANKPISKTYKGILRISNNIDLNPEINDAFLSKEYYTSNNNNNWFGNGEQKTHDFLSGNTSVKRYKKINDAYTHLKLPVTDSMGNYLNFSLGIDSSLIGSNSAAGALRETESQFNENDNITFAVATSKNPIYLGLSERKLLNSKNIKGANLIIENDNNVKGHLIIENKFIHNDNVIEEIDSNQNVRTILPAFENPKKFDVIGYNQENYKKKDLKKDCFINLINLRDYVNEKVNRYINNKLLQVPTGTIINQFSSLDKWFCYSSNGPDDFNDWQGYRPSMQTKLGNANYAYWNLTSNRAIYSDNYLNWNGFNIGYATNELPPDFKRGYILCDGGPVDIHLTPSYIQDIDKRFTESLKLFFNLFHVIGYYYWNDKSQSSRVPPIHACEKINNDGEAKYRYCDNFSKGTFIWKKDTDPNVAYGITMATILAFKAFDEKISKRGHQFNSVEDAIEWLKNEIVPEEFIFNVIAPDESELKNDYFKYTNDSLGENININIGSQISSFSDTIPYYTYDVETREIELTTTKIYNMAEIYHLADLFVNRNLNNGSKDRADEWANYVYTFYVPQLYTETDPDVNLAYSYAKKQDNIIDTGLTNTVGQFIGSNGLVVAEKIDLKHTNTTITLDKLSHSFTTNYTLSLGHTPHTHALAKGMTEIVSNTILNKDLGKYKPYLYNTDRISKFQAPSIINRNRLEESTLTEDNILGADYYNYPRSGDKLHLAVDMMNNYILQEVQEAKISDKFNSFSGTYGKEYNNDGFYWYGRTSEPLWAENTIANTVTEKFNNDTHVGYFRPESIKMLPLIKL